METDPLQAIRVAGYFHAQSRHPASTYWVSTPDFAANAENLRSTLLRAARNAESRLSAIPLWFSAFLDR